MSQNILLFIVFMIEYLRQMVLEIQDREEQYDDV